jgi:deazaflavin-dependent oxidoreductase (nitroreductase family)
MVAVGSHHRVRGAPLGRCGRRRCRHFDRGPIELVRRVAPFGRAHVEGNQRRRQLRICHSGCTYQLHTSRLWSGTDGLRSSSPSMNEWQYYLLPNVRRHSRDSLRRSERRSCVENHARVVDRWPADGHQVRRSGVAQDRPNGSRADAGDSGTYANQHCDTGTHLDINRCAKRGAEGNSPTYFTDGDDVILIASNYGGQRHPAWYYNLRAHPECELHIGPRGGRFVAGEVDGADRERLYGLAEKLARTYAHHAKAAGDRTIPVLRLTPA